MNYHESILAPDELGVLAVHLRENLWIDRDTDMLAILDQATPDLDLAMMVRRAGMPGKATPDGILTRMKSTVIGTVLAQIEKQPDPAALELGLVLLKLSENVVDGVDKAIDTWRQQGRRTGLHGIGMLMRDLDAGLTIQANTLPAARARKYLADVCHVRKYEGRVSTWFGIGLDGRDFATLRHVVLIAYEWQPDEHLAAAVPAYPARKRVDGGAAPPR